MREAPTAPIDKGASFAKGVGPAWQAAWTQAFRMVGSSNLVTRDAGLALLAAGTSMLCWIQPGLRRLEANKLRSRLRLWLRGGWPQLLAAYWLENAACRVTPRLPRLAPCNEPPRAPDPFAFEVDEATAMRFRVAIALARAGEYGRAAAMVTDTASPAPHNEATKDALKALSRRSAAEAASGRYPATVPHLAHIGARGSGAVYKNVPLLTISNHLNIFRT